MFLIFMSLVLLHYALQIMIVISLNVVLNKLEEMNKNGQK